MTYRRLSVHDRLIRRLILTPAPAYADKLGRALIGPCLIWNGAVSIGGYGVIKDDQRRMRTVHRLAYMEFVGPIENELDHLCRVRRCASPAHLEDVTTAENLRRAEPWAHQVAKTHCPAGHPYDEVNTYWRKDHYGRKCRQCKRDRRRLASSA